MTKSSKIDYSKIDIDAVLKQRRQVAVIWCVEDVQHVRPDLSDDQAWEVLQTWQHRHDCEIGFIWAFLEGIADELFSQNDPQSFTEKGE